MEVHMPKPRGLIMSLGPPQDQGDPDVSHVNDELVLDLLERMIYTDEGRLLETFERDAVRNAIAPLRKIGTAKRPSEDARVARLALTLDNNNFLEVALDRRFFGRAAKQRLKDWLNAQLDDLLGDVMDTDASRKHREFILLAAQHLAVLFLTPKEAVALRHESCAA